MMKRPVKCMVMALFLTMCLPVVVSAQEPVVELTLQKALEIALAENPTIRVADKDIELKKISDKEAWMNLLPTLDGSMSLSHSIQVAAIKTQMGEFKMGMDGSTTAMGNLTLALPVFAPAAYQNMKLTKEDIILAQEKARSSRLDLVNQVTKAYYSALLATDSRDVIKKSYELTERTFNDINKMYEVGRVSEYDKLSAEVQMRTMSSSVVSAENGVELALLRLKVLMGIDSNLKVKINDSLEAYENTMTLSNTEVTIGELENNSALRQIDMNKTLLERARKILNTNFMPTVAIALQGQYQSYSNDNWNVFKYHFSPSSTLSLSINIPIFHATNFTKLQSNRLQMEQLLDTRLNTQRQLSMAAESYRKNMVNSITKYGTDLDAVKKADKAVAISSKRYEVGRGTVLELNQSQISLVQAELTLRQGIYDYLTNKADLDYTLGRE